MGSGVVHQNIDIRPRASMASQPSADIATGVVGGDECRLPGPGRLGGRLWLRSALLAGDATWAPSWPADAKALSQALVPAGDQRCGRSDRERRTGAHRAPIDLRVAGSESLSGRRRHGRKVVSSGHQRIESTAPEDANVCCRQSVYRNTPVTLTPCSGCSRWAGRSRRSPFRPARRVRRNDRLNTADDRGWRRWLDERVDLGIERGHVVGGRIQHLGGPSAHALTPRRQRSARRSGTPGRAACAQITPHRSRPGDEHR